MSWRSMQGSDLTVNNLTVLGKLTVDDTSPSSSDSLQVGIIEYANNQILLDTSGNINLNSQNVQCSNNLVCNNLNCTTANNVELINNNSNNVQIDLSANGIISLEAQNVLCENNLNCSNLFVKNSALISSNNPAGGTTPTLQVTDNTSGNSIQMIHDAGSGSYNPIVQTGDSVILSKDETKGLGELSITNWSSIAGGLRTSANGTTGIYGSGNSVVVSSNGTAVTGVINCNSTISCQSLMIGGEPALTIAACGSTFGSPVFINSSCSSPSPVSQYTITASCKYGIINVSCNTYTHTVQLISSSNGIYTWTVSLYNETGSGTSTPAAGSIYYMCL